MSQRVETKIADHFGAITVDVTPGTANGLAKAIHAPVTDDAEFTNLCRTVLSADEKSHSKRLTLDADRTCFVQRRAFRRYCASRLTGSPLIANTYSADDYGRPVLASLPSHRFSFSSTRKSMLAAWSTKLDLGVDIESPTDHPDAIELVPMALTSGELDYMDKVSPENRARLFFKFWTLKEAALKSTGRGLPGGLRSFEFRLEPHLRVVSAPSADGGAESFTAYLLEDINMIGALLIHRKPLV